MGIKRISDDVFTSWHDRRVDNAVEELEDEGYEVTEVREIKRPFLGMDVMFSGNITEIHYKKEVSTNE